MSKTNYSNLLFSDDMPDDELEKLLAKITEEASEQPPTPPKANEIETSSIVDITSDLDKDFAPIEEGAKNLASQPAPIQDLQLQNFSTKDKGKDIPLHQTNQPSRLTDENLKHLLVKSKAVLEDMNHRPNNSASKLDNHADDNDVTAHLAHAEAKDLASTVEAQNQPTTSQPLAVKDTQSKGISFESPDQYMDNHIKSVNQGNHLMNQENVSAIKQQITALQGQIHDMAGQFFSINETSAKLIGQVRELQLTNPSDFAITYEQTYEFRTKLVTARKQFMELTSLLDLAEEALESESYTKLTRNV